MQSDKIEDHGKYHEELNAIIKQYPEEEWIENFKLNKCKIGDLLYISYITYSQRYIESYFNQFGKVIKINKTKDKVINKTKDKVINKTKITSIVLFNHLNKKIIINNEDDITNESFGGYTNDHSVYIRKLNLKYEIIQL